MQIIRGRLLGPLAATVIACRGLDRAMPDDRRHGGDIRASIQVIADAGPSEVVRAELFDTSLFGSCAHHLIHRLRRQAPVFVARLAGQVLPGKERPGLVARAVAAGTASGSARG